VRNLEQYNTFISLLDNPPDGLTISELYNQVQEWIDSYVYNKYKGMSTGYDEDGRLIIGYEEDFYYDESDESFYI
jgi:hypothetical protein